MRVAAITVLLTVLAAAAAAWLALRGPPPRRRDGFLDFGAAPRLVFYRGDDSAASRRFEAEWEAIKRAVGAADLNVSTDAVDVHAPATRAVPSLELARPHRAVEAYDGPLTRGAVVAWLRAEVPCAAAPKKKEAAA